MSFARSIVYRQKDGIKSGTHNMYLDIAVCITAWLAATFDTPIGISGNLGSMTLIPFSSSVYLMKKALRNPAVEHAKKALTEFMTTSLDPVMLLV